MDISLTTSTNTTHTKSQDQSDTHETQPTATKKSLSFTNGVLKRHVAVPPVEGIVSYKECLKNHAASLGGHSLDGCGEFMPSPNIDTTNPTSLKCAACGCHRNFHRRDSQDSIFTPPPPPPTLEYQPHHRHHPPPPPESISRNSMSPPPICSYYPSHAAAAPHMLVMSAQQASPISRKRFRTRFSQVQKEKMRHFAEKLGWKMLKKDEEFVQEFCNEIGVEKGVFKVWMHNNKNTYGKKDHDGAAAAAAAISNHDDDNKNNNNVISNNGGENVNDNVGHVGATNGSSSSS